MPARKTTLSVEEYLAGELHSDIRHEYIDGEVYACLLYTSDAADERSSVDLGGRRIIQKKQKKNITHTPIN